MAQRRQMSNMPLLHRTLYGVVAVFLFIIYSSWVMLKHSINTDPVPVLFQKQTGSEVFGYTEEEDDDEDYSRPPLRYQFIAVS